jgi:hypothetical protein
VNYHEAILFSNRGEGVKNKAPLQPLILANGEKNEKSAKKQETKKNKEKNISYTY